MSQDIVYTATNTASEFHNDNAKVRLLFGPVGCGKSVAGCLEIMSRALQQDPGNDGVRRTKWAVIRNTYPDLKATTISTWLTWYPEEIYGKIKWDSPIKHHLKFPLPDGTKLDCEVLFMPLDSIDDIKKLNSLEVTGIYINELQFMHYKLFETAMDRINRFPPKVYGAPITWNGLFADTNPPDTDHWIYSEIDQNRPKGWSMYRYEPTVITVDSPPTDGTRYETSKDGTHYINNPDADYRFVQNDPDYCISLIPGKSDEKIKVSYMGGYGAVIDGKAVHPTYNDKLHTSDKIFTYNPHVELALGWDFGLTPACAIVQLSPNGQLLSLDELWTERMDLRGFTSNIVVPHLDRYYEGWRKDYVSRHDPAGQVGSQTDGKSCQAILLEHDIKSLPAAESNDPTPRRDGLDYFLGKMVDGQPAYTVSLKCPMIRKGLMGNFQYARIKVSGEERYHDKPLKNKYSHICEALEYIVMHYAPILKKPPPSGKKPSSINRGSFI